MALLSWPSTPDPRLLPWAIWRFQNQPDPKPPIPKTIPKYWWEFLQWAAWRRKGAVLADRPDVTKKIPAWGWSYLKQINVAVPLKPPPPPPPPPPEYVNSWKLPWPAVMVAWGPTTDWREAHDFQQFVDKVVAHNVRTVILQIGQHTPWQADLLRSAGRHVACWGVASSIDERVLAESRAEGYMPQIEGPYQYESAIASLEAGIGKGLSLSTVTTLAGLETYIQRPDGSLSTLEVERLIRAGCTHGLIECYKQDGDGTVHFPVGDMMWSANRRGFPYKNPILGLYWGVPFTEYKPSVDEFGGRICSWLAETMLPGDWDTFKNLS